MGEYAKNTSVSVSQSKAEIEKTLERYGAGQFLSGWSNNQAVIGFTMDDRQVRFVLTLPDKNDRAFTHHSRGERTTEAALKQWEQSCRQRWRALNLVIKAKLEAVESGISEFENEFLANIVMPDGRTVGDHTRPVIDKAYLGGSMVPLLPDFTGED